jgi:hypothetical protein
MDAGNQRLWIQDMSDKPIKYKRADRSEWPEITRKEYLDLFSRTVHSLLATGHYTVPCDVNIQSPGFHSPLRENTYHGHMEACVFEPAEVITFHILHECGYRAPELPEMWLMKDKDESL